MHDLLGMAVFVNIESFRMLFFQVAQATRKATSEGPNMHEHA